MIRRIGNSVFETKFPELSSTVVLSVSSLLFMLQSWWSVPPAQGTICFVWKPALYIMEESVKNTTPVMKPNLLAEMFCRTSSIGGSFQFRSIVCTAIIVRKSAPGAFHTHAFAAAAVSPTSGENRPSGSCTGIVGCRKQKPVGT